MNLQNTFKPTGVFADRNARILGFTHQDMDGVSAGVILKNFYHNIDLHFINYGQTEREMYQFAVDNAGDYDGIVFTDFTPNISDEFNGTTLFNAFKDIGLPMLVIDHHKKVISAHNPDDNTFVIDGKCGAYLTYEFYSKVCPELTVFEDLCFYTNIIELFLFENPSVSREDADYARNLAIIFSLIVGKGADANYERGLDRFIDGDVELSDDELYMIDEKNKADEKMFQEVESSSVKLPNNGILIIKCPDFSAMNERLNAAGYAYAIHMSDAKANGEYPISFRFYPKNYPSDFREHFNQNESEMDKVADWNIVLNKLGGGGHARASGITCKSEDEQANILKKIMPFLNNVFDV